MSLQRGTFVQQPGGYSEVQCVEKKRGKCLNLFLYYGCENYGLAPKRSPKLISESWLSGFIFSSIVINCALKTH